MTFLLLQVVMKAIFFIRQLILVAVCGIFLFSGYGQSIRYSVANGHAHNDYEHNIPFTEAYNLGLGSIEADVILEGDTLFVGHNRQDIFEKPLYFERDYIQPLVKSLSLQKDSSRKVLLLIDLKTPAIPTLKKVIEIIENHPLLTTNRGVQFVITGNQPAPADFDSYPPYIYFDGNINNPGHIRHIDRIGLFSDNFRKYSSWNGKGKISIEEQKALTGLIQKAHNLNRQIRFWGCPDNLHTWQVFMRLQVDYLNTDHIYPFADYFR